MIKKLILIFCSMLITLSVKCQNANSIDFDKDADEVFMAAIVSIDELKYEILEIQSESGYILFQNDNNKYLLLISENGKNISNIKLQKLDNNSSLVNIQENLYKIIEQNLQIGFIGIDE